MDRTLWGKQTTEGQSPSGEQGRLDSGTAMLAVSERTTRKGDMFQAKARRRK